MFESVERTAAGVSVRTTDGRAFDAEVLLIAVGRGPATANLGYEEAGVAMDRGFVLTDEYGRTSVRGVWAVGDIVPGLQLAHRGFARASWWPSGSPVSTLDQSMTPGSQSDLLRARDRLGGAVGGQGR